MRSIFNGEPLTRNSYAPLALGSIKPEGWLKEQLDTQRIALMSRLNDIEFGNDANVWLRSAYLLDGLIPLAWALNDEQLKAEATRHVDSILASAKDDGWFGVKKSGDYWLRVATLRPLKDYFMATADKRVLMFMDKFFKYEYRSLGVRPFSGISCARGGENIMLALWLYNITGQKYLLELCRKLRLQTLDWTHFFHTFPNTQPMNKFLRWERLKEALEEEKDDKLEGEHRPYFKSQYMLTNAVNLAMGLKTPGMISLFKSGFKEHGGFDFGWKNLMKYHGLACGMFTGDTHINGANPTQGMDICATAELMNSLETLIGALDSSRELPDYLEKLAFNVLPAFFTADMKAHQRVQQGNQISINTDERSYYNLEAHENLIKSAPHDDVEADNYHQAFPKFAASLWYATNDGGLAAISYSPCTVRTRAGDTPVRLHVNGGYPFTHEVSIEISVKKPADFPIYLRMPSWTFQPMICLPEGEIMSVRAGETACLRRVWRSGDVIRVELPMQPRIKSRWHHQSVSVELGPLNMVYKPDEIWEKLDENSFGVTPGSDWNYALIREEPTKTIATEGREHGFKQGEPPVKLLVKAARIPWEMKGGNMASTPIIPILDQPETCFIELIPMGDSTLHISQFPMSAIKPERK